MAVQEVCLRPQIRLEDFATLTKTSPKYELYIFHSQVELVRGQISPGYNDADRNLEGHSVGSR